MAEMVTDGSPSLSWWACLCIAFLLSFILIPVVVFVVKKRSRSAESADLASNDMASRGTGSCSVDPSCSSSVSGQPGYGYDVVLSFRGETRKGFADCLYWALVDAGIRVLRENEGIGIGEEIFPELLAGIETSRISIPIFSENYASSEWCLLEFALMMECREARKQIVLPVFYDVTPNTVQNQTGSYASALQQHAKKLDREIVQRWRKALTQVGSLKGWELENEANGHQGKLIKTIVTEVLKELISKPGYGYDVFLSFRGEDTRKGFADCLYWALVGAGIRVFMDNEKLRIGDEIGHELLAGIKTSRISIPIFSENYASSKWCLVEFALMMECREARKQIVLPVFYDVTPNTVQNQTGSYASALQQHAKKLDREIVQRWRKALTQVGSLKGWELENEANGHQGKLIKMIVAEVLKELKTVRLSVDQNLVGIDSPMNAGSHGTLQE